MAGLYGLLLIRYQSTPNAKTVYDIPLLPAPFTIIKFIKPYSPGVSLDWESDCSAGNGTGYYP
jgi:hypothetical protein